ncbi:MAG TPA: M14 family metallopeptidase, partial [Jiangellales bacterium]|nr:M14 family metallopeptidase [Jiangellales bacterium]
MRRVSAVLISVLALVAGLLGAVGAANAAPTPTPGGVGPDVYTGVIQRSQINDIVDLGVDRHELLLSGVRGQDAAKGSVRVEAILTEEQADGLREGGVDLEPKTVDGMTATERATLQAAEGYEVFRTYGGDGGLREEFEQAAADNPHVTKLVTIGQSVNGTDIVALKVSRDAQVQPDGQKPATVYVGAQHAREWITPEMIRRLMHLVLDGYGNDPQITDLVNTTELWFVPVANPDGYDWTFEPGQRLWRKNLRDNNGDGVIMGGDGVDPNRNFATKWGYDNEGSSPLPGSEVFRGTAPGSEPETQALDSFMERLRPEFLVNYHSAAELLLYGVGWQVATPSPDDVIYEALAGDDVNPAVEGYDPDISAELYTTNGETTEHMQSAYGVLGFTPEMSTCQTVSAQDPDDEWEPLDCDSVFNFPDDEELVQEEFEKNIPFALSVAESAKDPADPVSVVGRAAEDFRLDTFDVSYGDPQTVAVVAKRELRNLRLRYRVAGGPERSVAVQEWQGGERYGGSNDRYYAEFRGQVIGVRPGQQVQVWFTGVKPGTGPVASERFTYRLAQDTGNRVLVVANEDYTGFNPDYPPGVTAPQYLDAHVQAVEDAGYAADSWDVDAQGVPHDLGVLGHYDGVLWYLGDNRITQDDEDQLTSTPFGQLPDISVAERQQYLTMAVRDYLNAGGKLLHAGETAQFEGLPGISDAVGGLYYGLNGDPSAECVISPRPDGGVEGFFEDCLILADDFRQYWLGGFTRTSTSGPEAVLGVADPIEGFEGTFGGPVVGGANPLDEAGVFVPTSDVLPEDQFPQFASQGAAEYASTSTANPYAPIEGERYAGALHADSSYMRLTRTVDVPAAPATTQLRFQLSYSVEPAYDHVIIEARTPGQDNWTTLPDLEGGTSTAPPAECAAGGFLLALHPFLANYLGGADCTEPGDTGTW